MTRPDAPPPSADDLPPPMSPAALGALLGATVGGVVLAVVVLPSWAPALARSLDGEEPAAYWYLSRASGLVAYALLWASTMLGLAITNRWARLWPGGPTAFDLHQHTGLLGLAFALFHALVLLGDRHLGAGVAELLVPFAAPGERSAWIALGQLALTGGGVVGLSFYVRKRMGPKIWRALHFGGFTVFVLAAVHGLLSGSDTQVAWVRAGYVATSGAVLLATAWRLVALSRAPSS